MKISKIELSKFKKISDVSIQIDDINVIVGGNNAGKSSILQGIHFSIIAAAIARQQGLETFASELLLYNPTPDFEVLKNGTPYKNGGDDKGSALTINVSDEDGKKGTYNIQIHKGRNHGNIGCKRNPSLELGQVIGQKITDINKLFSIYVPGLAGLSRVEELKSKAIVGRGVASGDANIYLRNVLYYIDEKNKISELNDRLGVIFPGNSVKVIFDEETDTYIKVLAVTGKGEIPIELMGTGFLQVLQILSYISYFNPKILLLDEPDSHLHANNQASLTELLMLISEETSTQVLLCTHSREIINTLYGKANFVWLKEGQVKEQGYSIDKLPILTEIGALDDFDKFRSSNIKAVILTEDNDTSYLKKLFQANHFNLNETLIYSYRSSSILPLLPTFVEFIKEVSNTSLVIVHRDRDFMTEEEIEMMKSKISRCNAIPFITKGSDIESYFINPHHISVLTDLSLEEAKEWLDKIAKDNHNEILTKFYNKREEVKRTLYKKNADECPSAQSIAGNNIPVVVENRIGKYMLKKINGDMMNKLGRVVDLKQESEYLSCDELLTIIVPSP